MGKTRFFHLAKEIIMYFVILMMIPFISTRKTVRIKRNSNQSDNDEITSGIEMDWIVFDDYNYYDDQGEKSCKVDEYEIIIQMGNAFFSGTDDEVEIRLYG